MALLSELSQKLFSGNFKGVLHVGELQDLALFTIKVTFFSSVAPAQENVKSELFLIYFLT